MVCGSNPPGSSEAIKISQSNVDLEHTVITQVGGNYVLVEAVGVELAAGLAAEFLPLPHLMLTL